MTSSPDSISPASACTGTGIGTGVSIISGIGSSGEPRTPIAGLQNKQLQNVKDHPSVCIKLSIKPYWNCDEVKVTN